MAGSNQGGAATAPPPTVPPPIAPPPTVQPPQSRQKLPTVTVEVVAESNRNVMFHPLAKVIRGRWDHHDLAAGDQSERGLREMPVIPGLEITVSHEDRHLRVEDPLARPENIPLLQRVNAVWQHISRGNQQITFAPMDVRQDPTDDEIATWYYWVMRLVQGKQARVIRGARVPENEAEIRKALPKAEIKKKFYTEGEMMAKEHMQEVAVGAAAAAVAHIREQERRNS